MNSEYGTSLVNSVNTDCKDQRWFKSSMFLISTGCLGGVVPSVPRQ
jgi:hypothetical protein